jgi:hypothetical protein
MKELYPIDSLITSVSPTLPKLSRKNSTIAVYVYYNCERRQYLIENYFKKIQNENGTVPEELMKRVTTNTEGFGVSILLTSLNVPAKQVYLDYQARGAIEEMFDAHKNALGFDMKYEAS